MKQLARSIEQNNPEVHLIVLLVDERPEEVTDIRQWLDQGEVACVDVRPARRGAHPGRRAHHRAGQADGRGRPRRRASSSTASPACAGPTTWPPRPAAGSCPAASTPAPSTRPRSSSGPPATCEEGGSLTILATALVETELPHGRRTSSRSSRAPGTWSCGSTGGWPSGASTRRSTSTRRPPATRSCCTPGVHLHAVWKLRRVLSGLAAEGGNAGPASSCCIERLKNFRTNDEFLAEVAKAPGGM